jgi:hypothetical protein
VREIRRRFSDEYRKGLNTDKPFLDDQPRMETLVPTSANAAVADDFLARPVLVSIRVPFSEGHKNDL